MAYTHIKPGEEIEVSSRLYSSSAQEVERLSNLVKLSFPELERMKTASEEEEKAIFAKFYDLVSEWQNQAHETVLFREALEYLRTSIPTHTSNQWKEDQHGRHEMSNMVYVFSWRVYERTRYNHALGKSVPVAWELTWSLHFNTPQNPDNARIGWKISGQDRKVFGTKEEMDKYLQGRIKAYAHLFTEISPPIPTDEEGRFSVHGVLLPGYTVETPEPTPQEVADSLLDFLGDEDVADTPKPEKREPPPKPAHKQAKPHKKSNSAPIR